MEPRPHERGNLSLLEPKPRNAQRFNGATSSRTWKLSQEARAHNGRGASMEPRPHERGNVTICCERGDVDFASMEPRPHERGNLAAVPIRGLMK